MRTSSLAELSRFGQSIWLDYIDRKILKDGTLEKLIEHDRLGGLTSNPAIFEKAIAHGEAYEDSIRQLQQQGASIDALYNELVLTDIGMAADAFLPVYKSSKGRDGYVSIEVSPLLARDTEGTLKQARELWQRLSRRNIMIKVPGTREGLPAIRQLLTEGINVNVTLLFSVGRYLEVLTTYIDALEQRRSAGLPLSNVASVASFFLSRIDVKVDAMLDEIIHAGGKQAAMASKCRGQAAVASAAFAYRRFMQITAEKRWQDLAVIGAQTQRLLWASTGTKNPSYSDVKYVESLIAEDTVNTLPLETLDAYRDHGKLKRCMDENIERAPEVMRHLADLGINMRDVDDALEEEGIEKFIKPYQSLLASFENIAVTA